MAQPTDKLLVLLGQSNITFLNDGSVGTSGSPDFRAGNQYLISFPEHSGSYVDLGDVTHERAMRLGAKSYDFAGNKKIAVANISAKGSSMFSNNSVGLGWWAGPYSVLDLFFKPVLQSLMSLYSISGDTANVDVVWHHGSLDMVMGLRPEEYLGGLVEVMSKVKNYLGLSGNDMRVYLCPPGSIELPVTFNNVSKILDAFDRAASSLSQLGINTKLISTHYDLIHDKNGTDPYHPDHSGFLSFAERIADCVYGGADPYGINVSYSIGASGVNEIIYVNYGSGVSSSGEPHKMFNVLVNNSGLMVPLTPTGSTISGNTVGLIMPPNTITISGTTSTIFYAHSAGYKEEWYKNSIIFNPSANNISHPVPRMSSTILINDSISGTSSLPPLP